MKSNDEYIIENPSKSLICVVHKVITISGKSSQGVESLGSVVHLLKVGCWSLEDCPPKDAAELIKMNTRDPAESPELVVAAKILGPVGQEPQRRSYSKSASQGALS